jgi:hypothetical protein
MKIVQIIHSLNPGGAERLVVDLSNELSCFKDNKVFLISLKNRVCRNENFYQSELSKEVEYIPMNFEDGFKLSYLFRLSKTMKHVIQTLLMSTLKFIILFLLFSLIGEHLLYIRCIIMLISYLMGSGNP